MPNPKPEIRNPKPEKANSRASDSLQPWQTPGLAHYYVVCLVAMSVVWLVLLRRPLPATATLFPILVGILGIAVRWRLAPVILLITLAICLKFESTYDTAKMFRISDLILCAATLAYVVAQYRLQSMLDHIVPIDPRRRGGPPRWHVGLLSLRYRPEVIREARSPQLVTRDEVGMLVLASALWAGVAQVCWNLLPLDKGNPDTEHLPPPVWRAILLAWIIGAGLYVVFGLIKYWSLRSMTAAEAILFLQDVLWKETRAEQRRLNRWSAWARLRRNRKE